MLALSLHNVDYSYPARRRQPARKALQSIALDAPAGQSIALLGPNGSGKSTLLRIITGMLAPAGGDVKVFDRTPADARELLAVVFQHPGLDRHMSVWENLRDSAALYGVPHDEAKNRADELLRDLRIGDRRHSLVKTLSGGLARRVDLCRALLAQPRLLILDEPTTGLDLTARREFLDLLESRRAQAAGGSDLTLLMSTHLIDEAERMDRVLMMHEGRIVADGTPTELRSQVGIRRASVQDERWSPPAPDAHRWRRAPAPAGWVRDLAASDDVAALARDLANAGVPFSIGPPTLADAFEALTGAKLEGDAAPPRPRSRHRAEAAA